MNKRGREREPKNEIKSDEGSQHSMSANKSKIDLNKVSKSRDSRYTRDDYKKLKNRTVN